MIIAIPTNDKIFVAGEFGRAGFFVLINTENGERTFLDNSENLNAAQGAGIKTSTDLIKNNVKAVLSPMIGPKAFTTLNEGAVEKYLVPKKTDGTSYSIDDAYNMFIAKSLPDMATHK